MPIIRGYATLAELKSEVGIPPTDTVDDARLELSIEAASRLIDAWTNRHFYVDDAPVARYYATLDDDVVEVDPIADVTDLLVRTDHDGDYVHETTWTVNVDYRLSPPNAAADGEPYTRIVATGMRRFPVGTARAVEVTAIGGWPGGPPAPIRKATLLQSAKLWKRKDAPFGVAGSVEFGSELRLLERLDPDAVVLCAAYRRPWVFA